MLFVKSLVSILVMLIISIGVVLINRKAIQKIDELGEL
jgi:hypothetical protein